MKLKEFRYNWSILVLQIFVGLGTLLSQFYLQQQSSDREYVHMAVTILSQPKNTNTPQELRKWATDILAAKSPVPFEQSFYNGWIDGDFILPMATSSSVHFDSEVLKNLLQGVTK